MFNPEMLTVARESREMPQGELARLTGISSAMVSRIENRLREPTEDMIEKIAKVLRYPKEFFYQTDAIYGLPVAFHRKRKSLPARTLNRIHAEITIRALHISKLLKAVDIDHPLELPQLDLEDYGSPEEVARAVRSTWLMRPGPVHNLMQVVESAGVIIIPCNFGDGRIDAVGWKLPKQPPMIFYNASFPMDRIRFSIAHELGHLVMHDIPTPSMEEEADQFASEFLMPESDIKPHLSGITLQKLASLKLVWKTSMAALLRRAHQFGKVTDRQYRYFWTQMGSRGYRRREPAELDPPIEEPRLLNDLLELHTGDLGYSIDEISRALHLLPEEYPRYYGGSRTLRLVG